MKSPLSGVGLFVVGIEEGHLPITVGCYQISSVGRIGKVSHGSGQVNGLGQVDGL